MGEAGAKRILFLGAGHHQIVPIEYARRAGFYTITCDNRPGNPGHRLADRSYDVSTVDLDGILAVARAERVDAIVTYGSDIAAPTAAYVCEKLGLPGNPYEAVRTLTDKGRFRRFQRECGFFRPEAVTLGGDDLPVEGQPQHVELGSLRYPVIVKPVDSSGGKGITKLAAAHGLVRALRYAISHSISRRAIVEEIVEPLGYQVCGEGFLQHGRVVFHSFANEHFAEFVVPVGESFPSMFDASLVERAVDVLGAMFQRLGMRRGPFNFDLMFTKSGEVFVIEIGPRNGGNRMPEAVKYSTGIDTIQATLDAALGEAVAFDPPERRFYATYSIHAKKDGVLESITYRDGFRRHIVDEAIYQAPGTAVRAFTMGSNMVGCLILRFEAYAEMLHALDHMERNIDVRVS